MTEKMNNYIFNEDNESLLNLDIKTELVFSKKNLPKGELVPVFVDDRKEYVLIPLDVKDGTILKVSGGGKHSPGSGKTGDLYVLVHIKEEKKFPWKKVLIAAVVTAAVIAVAFLLKELTLRRDTTVETTVASCAHSWTPADCTTPKTCSKCGETTGKAVGHVWRDATCISPKNCEVCGMVSGTALEHQWQDANYSTPKTCSVCGATEGEPIKPDIRVNEIITFGAYEQDGFSQNGKEEIEWLVLDVQDNYALLLSRYALDSQKYHKVTAQVSWNNCSLREWLNNEFMNTAFSKSQQEVILNTELDNGALVDRIFILDCREVDRYVTDWNTLICAPTSYAVSRGAGKNQPEDSRDAVSWWLRSLDEDRSQAHCVSFKGEQFTYMVGNDFMSVRPAMWIDLSKAVLK